jgi:truncated hemoglobin YjbI
MDAALNDIGAAPELQQTLMASFFKTADWMRNTGPHPASIATTLKETP